MGACAAGAAQSGSRARVRLLFHLCRQEAEPFEGPGGRRRAALGHRERFPDGQRRVRTGSLRSPALAGLVSAHHPVHAGSGRSGGAARRREKNLPPRRFPSAYRKSGICSLPCCAAAGTAWNIFCTGLSGEDITNSWHVSSTSENNSFSSLPLSYNCSTKLRCSSRKAIVLDFGFVVVAQ